MKKGKLPRNVNWEEIYTLPQNFDTLILPVREIEDFKYPKKTIE